MRVYGGGASRKDGAELLASMSADMQRAAALPPGLARHSLLVGLLIDAGMLAQGVADARFEVTGRDAKDADDVTMALTAALARCCTTSWRSGFAEHGTLPFALLARCQPAVPKQPLLLKVPEGYAFYALYPETYAEAARRCREAAPRWEVVGLRSIGTSLAAMVAVGLGAPTPRSLRPVGHPFAREIAASPPKDVDPTTAFAVVDEGPGLSGSSMAAAGRWLQQAGITSTRLHFFTSHPGMPGPEASVDVRTLWAEVSRQHLGFDEVVRDAPRVEQRLRHWVETLTGPLTQPLQDIGGGAWRSLQVRSDGEPLPPTHPWQERRKYLALSRTGTWLVKFVGLGRMGRRAYARAQALATAGFTPGPLGLCHGFVVERWRDDLRPLPARMSPTHRAAIVGRVGDYLAFRARTFPAPDDGGASMPALLEMTRCNAAEALGDAAGERCTALARAFGQASAAVLRVETDNRMHRWEWLGGPSLLLKTDAIDHATAHDLVGCQDIAWDVVGAEVEFDLSPEETSALIARMAQQGIAVERSLIALLRPAYLAFQWAHFAMAVNAADPADAASRTLLAATRDRYRDGLRSDLQVPVDR